MWWEKDQNTWYNRQKTKKNNQKAL
jgi:hypothetical protein